MHETIIKPKSRFLLKKYIENFSAKNILLLTGNNSFNLCGASKFIKSLNLNKQITRYKVKVQNIEFEEAKKIVNYLDHKKFDLLVSIGGGSVIDMGKTVNALRGYRGNKKQFLQNSVSINDNLLPFIAMPTTSGTGSEETHFAVVYDKKKKYSVADKKLKPFLSIVDPEFTYSLPSNITAYCGFDALSQAVESYWSVSASRESKIFSKASINIITENLENAVNRNLKTAKNNMCVAANYSGKAINISKTTAPHALSYEISRLLNIPHGYAVALTLGKFFEINEISTKKETKINFNTHKNNLKKLYGFFNVKNYFEAEKKWYDLMKKCNLEVDFEVLQLNLKKNVKKIIQNINIERLQNHPTILKRNQLEKIFI